MRYILDPLPPITVSDATPGSPSTVVGSEPIWADGSDASYLDAVGVYQFNTAIAGFGTASLPAVPGIPLGYPERAVFTIRARVKCPSGVGFPFAELDAPNSIKVVGTSAGMPPTVPTWIEYTASPSVEQAAALLAALAAGTAKVAAGAGGEVTAGSSIVTYAWQIYEVQVLVDAFGGLQPPLRQHPRTDGLGMSTVRRVEPSSRSVQRSLRQGPGAYL